MRFFKSRKDLSKIAKSIDGLNLMIKDIIPKIEKSYEYSEFKEDILFSAYIARKNVIDLIEENNWSMNLKIMVSTFENRRIPLILGYSKTVNQIQLIANHTGFQSVVEDILEKGKSYHEFESQLPKEELKKI
jgi:hypothetical protein|tara:strand:- start:212 stop:607 length:396 start_codon:yes stop_codon:yes gene_type:complete